MSDNSANAQFTNSLKSAAKMSNWCPRKLGEAEVMDVAGDGIQACCCVMITQITDLLDGDCS